MVQVGSLPAVADALENDRLVVDDFVIVRCPPDIRALANAFADRRASWLLMGTGIDEESQTHLLHTGRIVSPGLRVAVVGSEDDLDRCDRWAKRGCAVYLSSGTPLKRLLHVLRFAEACRAAVVDECFLTARQLQSVQPLTPLTPREREVLLLVSLGRRNTEVAAELGLSTRTVEFHVRNLLVKLGARNRVEAVDRGRLLDL